ncbi:MAG: tetratricopeptide repeat protein [Planctomycetes bacterium]|jgi:tetratricopeptide (TPR) repeat protein|nr:tetratricopeptide repeat protein [Planctomycetota bacterium]
MDRKPNHLSCRASVCLMLAALCGSLAEGSPTLLGWARPAAGRRTVPAKPAGAPNKPAVNDPCAPAQTAAPQTTVAEPSRNSTSALVNLVARAKVRQEAAGADAGPHSPPATELWTSRISAPDPADEAEASLALQRLIRRVHSMTFSDKGTSPPSAPTTNLAPTEPVAAVSLPAPAVASRVPAASISVESGAVPGATPVVSPQVQKTFESLRQNPSRIGDPMEAADLLFLSGRPTDAIPFYEEQLRRLKTDAASRDDRAWALFQLGNCLRETNVARAQETYGKLMAEYPESPWTEMARAGSRFLTWHQSTRLDQIATPHQP